jgi:hypothetical protein
MDSIIVLLIFAVPLIAGVPIGWSLVKKDKKLKGAMVFLLTAFPAICCVIFVLTLSKPITPY